MIRNQDIVTVAGTGAGDIATVLRHPQGIESAIVQLLLHFDSGTGAADLVLSKDSWRGSLFAAKLLTIQNVGGGGVDVNLQVDIDRLHFWRLTAARDLGDGDGLRLAWTDPGTSEWGYELFLVDARRIGDV